MRIVSIVLVFAAAIAGGAAACKGDGGAAAVAVVPGAPAGDVTELAGAVHATRDGKPRALAKGDVVSGDDVIATGADGRVTIVLRHNQVAWALGPNKEKKVGDSAAWAAAKGAAAEEATDDKSAAAGRHAERSATDTGVSMDTKARQDTTKQDDAERREVEEKLAALQKTDQDMDRAAQALADAQNEADRRAAQEKLAALQRERADVEERIAAAKAAAARAERKRGVHVSQACLDNPLAKGCDDGDGDTAAHADPASLTATITAHADQLHACYAKLLEQAPRAAGTLVLRVRVGADGKPSSVEVSGDDALAPMRDCAKAAVESLSFPAPGSPVAFEYPLELKP